MKDNIYDMINDGKFENEDYDVEILNDMEKKKYKNNIRKSIGGSTVKARKRYKGIAAAMVFVVLGTGFLSTDAGAQVMLDMSESIGSALRTDKNIDDYKTVINKCVSDNGVNIQLNEVVLAKNKLIISTDISSDKLLKDDEMYDADKTIYINDKKVRFTGQTGSAGKVDDYTSESVMEYDLDSVNEEDLNGEIDIKIIYTKVSLYGDKSSVRGKWKFEFKTSRDNLMADTYEEDIDYEFTLDNGEKVILEKYMSNAVGQNIYARVENSNTKERDNVMLKGHDDLGNEVDFYLSRGREGYMDFRYNNYDRNIDDNAKTLTLTPYAVKMPEGNGKMPDSDEYIKVGESFDISINK
ncbi:MAG: DUF4179 domain-containing protein [Clostridium sp.]|nr:DUF4179 domain-containing protein [Clostridium sp.]